MTSQASSVPVSLPPLPPPSLSLSHTHTTRTHARTHVRMHTHKECLLLPRLTPPPHLPLSLPPGGAIRAVSDEELASYSAAKRKRHEESLALLAKDMQQRSNVRGGIPLPGMREPEPEDGAAAEAIPVIPEEEHALQLAVLQEWAALREQQKLEMK